MIEIPVVKLYGSTFKLIQNGHLFALQCNWFVSLHISLQIKVPREVTFEAVN